MMAGSPEAGATGHGSDDLKRRILFRSVGYMLSRALTGGLGALASLLLFRFLGPAEAGRFSVMLATTMTLGVLGGLGLHDMLARFVPERSPVEAAGIFRRSLKLIGGASAVWMGIFAILVWQRFLIPDRVIQIAPVFMLGTVVYSVYATSSGMAKGLGRLSLIPRLDLGANFLAKMIALGAVVLGGGFAAAYSAHTVIQLLVTVLMLYLLRDVLFYPEHRMSRTEMVYARFVLLGDLVRVLVETMNLYLLGILLGSAEVGIYAAGARFIRIVELLVLAPMAAPLLYYFSHPESSHMREGIVRRGSRVVGAAMGFAALLLTILAEPMVRILLGVEYLESITVARVYASHTIGMGILVLFVPFFSSINKPQFSILQGVLTFSINLVLALILIPRYGALGAAIASVAAILTTMLTASFFIGRRFSIGVLGASLRLLVLYGGSFALVMSGFSLLGCLVYLGGLIPFRLVRRDDLELFRSRGGRA